MLLPSERAVIESVFECRVGDRYGCEEVGLIASECERHNGMHLNVDHLFIEFLRPDGRPARSGEEGDIVVTDLINRGMPLIRYRVGDVGVPSARRCDCGRGSPLMERVVGRSADFLIKKDGSLVAGVSLVERTLTAIPGLEQMQIVQEELGALLINVVPDARYTAESEAALRREIETVFDDGTVVAVHRLSRLDQEKNGKYRFSICRVDARYQRTPSAVGAP
jgi:phenylacetate-CoA ligase